MLIIPILNTMFDDGFSPEYVEKLPPVELNQEYLTTLFNYTYSHLFDTYDRQNVLLLLAAVAIIISFLSNLFRYLVRGPSRTCAPARSRRCATRCSRA